MTTMDKFNCKIDKYDITCELIQTNIKFRVKCMSDLLLYESVYFNDTLPIQYKVLFSNSVVKLFNYIKVRPFQKLKFKVNQIIVVFDLIDEQKYLYLPLQKKQLDANDLLPLIQKLNYKNESLNNQNNALLKENQYIKERYDKLKKEIVYQKDQMKQEINNLKLQLKMKQMKQFQRIEKQKQEQIQIYDSQQSEEQEDNHKKFSVLRPPNMSCVKDELVIIWNQKKDIIDSVDDLKNRRPDCLTIKITGQQGQNGNQGIKELSQVLPRVHQLKYLKILNLYFNNSKFAKGVSLNYWPVLRAAIIAHLKIKFVNFIIGPKTWKSNKLSLLKQIQLYPKKIVINTQILYWK